MSSLQRDPGIVAVTGASGFIGRHLVRSLAAQGVQVRALSRSQGAIHGEGVDSRHIAGLDDLAGLHAALDGVSTVVHLAGRVHARLDGASDVAAECRRINTEGTAALLEESIASGARTFVFISSVKAVAGERNTILTADSAPQPVDAYGESKLEAEHVVKVMAGRHGLDAPILRLPAVYGPGMKANMTVLFRAVEKGLPLPLGSVKNRRSFAYVENAVSAIELLMTRASGGSEVYYVSDENDMSTPDLIRHIGVALGRAPRLLDVPPAALRGLQGIGGLLSRIPGFHLNGDALSAVLGSLFVDTSGLRALTGYQSPMSVETGMQRTAEWYKSRSREGGK